MILDERTKFCDATALDTTGTNTDLIGDQIDLGAASRDIGNGHPVYVVITVDTSVDSAADGASVEFVVASDAAAAIATDGTATEHVSTGVLAEADLAAGRDPIVLTLPVGALYERYLGILTKTTGEALTAGAVSIFLTFDPHGWRAYADAND